MGNSDESYSMIAVLVHKDHRVMDSNSSREFRIDPRFYAYLITQLEHHEKHSKNINRDEQEEDMTCSYGEENCDPDSGDPESICEGHRQEMAEAHAEGMQETFDY